MLLRYRLVHYLIVTSFVWGLYLIWLIPFQLYWVGMPWDMFLTWLIHGTALEMIFAYPLTLVIVYVTPKITKYFEDKSVGI